MAPRRLREAPGQLGGHDRDEVVLRATGADVGELRESLVVGSELDEDDDVALEALEAALAPAALCSSERPWIRRFAGS